MTREQLEHSLRAESAIAGDPEVLVIGSQSVLGSFTKDDLPLEATMSMEADIAFFDDPADVKADQVDGAIGELSAFHETFGYYAQRQHRCAAQGLAGPRRRLCHSGHRSGSWAMP